MMGLPLQPRQPPDALVASLVLQAGRQPWMGECVRYHGAVRHGDFVVELSVTAGQTLPLPLQFHKRRYVVDGRACGIMMQSDMVILWWSCQSQLGRHCRCLCSSASTGSSWMGECAVSRLNQMCSFYALPT